MSRLTGLRIILVLSFIGSGCLLLSYGSMALLYDTVNDIFRSGQVRLPDEMMAAYEMLISMPRTYFASYALLAALSIFGLAFMWNVRKVGFHCYTLAQLLQLAVSAFFLGKEQFAFGDLMFALFFIAFYYFNLRALGAFDSHHHDDVSNTDSDLQRNDPADAL